MHKFPKLPALILNNPRLITWRSLIRHALTWVLLKDEGISFFCKDRVYGNRVEHFESKEMPAIGIYALHENKLEVDVQPDPNERSLDFTVEILTKDDEALDDILDYLADSVERILTLDAIGKEMKEVLIALGFKGKAGEPIPLEQVDSLLELKFQSVDLDLAANGEVLMGVASLDFTLDRETPKNLPDLADFLIARTDWEIEPFDGLVDAKDKIEFEAMEAKK